MFRKSLNFLFSCLLLFACDSQKTEKNLIQNILWNSQEPAIERVLSNLEAHEIQILYTKIDRNTTGTPSFESFGFQENPNQYFYPASTVKMTVAILALQKIRKLQSEGIKISSESPMQLTFEDGRIQSQDSTHPNSELTISHLIKKIFLVSDNQAYNYLFDFVGRDYANEVIHNIGIPDFQLSHKFSGPSTSELSPSFVFFNPKGEIIYSQKPIVPEQNVQNNSLSAILKGKGYVHQGEVISEGMDFSKKNYASVQALNQILERVIFPEVFSTKEQFQLTPEDYDFLRYWMSRYPTEVEIPYYERKSYFDSYCKFFIYGDTEGIMNDEIRIFNKVGSAYGTTTDVAYIRDNAGIEFLLTATILTNSNEIFNDNQYEIDALGIPFLAAVGREIYRFEKNRLGVFPNR